MDRIQSIAPTERRRLAPLFTDHRHLRPDVDAVLQGYCGTAMANTGSDLQVAQLTLSVLTFLGGDPTHPVARHVVEQLSGEMIILVASEAWHALVRHVHGPRIIPQPRVAFSATPLELGHLRQLIADRKNKRHFCATPPAAPPQRHPPTNTPCPRLLPRAQRGAAAPPERPGARRRAA